MGGTWVLPPPVGPPPGGGRLMRGKTIEAREALAIGLVNEVVPADRLGIRAKELAREIAGVGPVAVQQVKQSLLAQAAGELEMVLDSEATAQAINYATKDIAEGVA